jgi:hypothetical protein
VRRISVVALRPGLVAGAVTRAITDADFDAPTTVDRLGSRLCAINARFGTTPGPDTPYAVVPVRR